MRTPEEIKVRIQELQSILVGIENMEQITKSPTMAIQCFHEIKTLKNDIAILEWVLNETK